MRSFKRKRKKRMRSKNKSVSDGESDYSGSRERPQIVYHPKKRKTMRLSRALSDLVKYTKSVRVHDIETQAYTSSCQVSSLNETVMNQILQLKPAELVRFNQRQLLRVYPSNYRVDSSNFNPQPYWNTGCHMVAMNYQTEGRMLELNRAKFASNGNSGYVLRPKCLNKGAFNPTLEDPLPGHRKTQLVLKIISGQQLPKPKDSMLGDRGEIIDPYVEVEIIGLPIDCKKQQTRVVDDNGFNPMWEETLVFNIQMPQIALVRFEVWDHDPIGRDFIGQRTIALRSMLPGYRHVYLEGMAESSIFVHVAINGATKAKPTNAVQVAKKHIQKAAQKHIKGQPRQASLDFSIQSSDDGRPVYRRDLDSMSQDSKNGDIFPLSPALPVRRAHKVKIQEPPKKPKRGILTRMASIESPPLTPAPFVSPDSFDIESQDYSDTPENNSFVQIEPQPAPLPDFVEEEESQTCEIEPPEVLEDSPEVVEENNEPDPQTDIVSERQSLPRHISRPLIPPPSPPRIRRTLETPAAPRPSSPIRTKHRSQSCPPKHLPSRTPMLNRKTDFQWQKRPESFKSSSISSGSTDSQEFVASSVPDREGQDDGTLQREMKALFEQKMREIRCKSPLFFDDEVDE
ncbi:hypothetical protein WMY93_011673 [Mugilogobius chulae]|uniref:Phosphoinositide phospholipase C n=1 Tax=Mugilogobius chulae TaxID=88201 RepID=A0AAW0P2S0_9GOBI